MQIKKTVVAGTMESSDIMITLEANEDNKIDIELNSSVMKQFGDDIKNEIFTTLTAMNIDSAKVIAVDKGALDCTIRARVKTAVCRACEFDNYFERRI